jgi:hypothetical protein
MKLLVVLFAPILTGLLFLFPAAASATPCANGSLQSYILLGSVGCTIDDKLFSNFSYAHSSISTGPPEVLFLSNPTADQVAVVPLLATSANPGLLFTGGWGIDGTAPPLLGFSMGFNVTVLPGGNLIKDESLLILGNSRTFTQSMGFVSIQDTASLLGVQIGAGGLTTQLSDMKTFSPVSTVGVSLSGRAIFGLVDSFQENFSEVVPEPSTWLLLGSGLVALAFARRKLAP